MLLISLNENEMNNHYFTSDKNGLYHSAPSGAEGATLRERRGQTTRGATAIYCAHRALRKWDEHMCPLGGGGGDLKGAKGTNNPRRDRYILRPMGA